VSHLSDYRGKIVLLEFWGSGCGPCQPPMRKLNQLAAEKRSTWGDQVALLSISTDRDPEVAHEHVASRGWNALRNFAGSRRDKNAYFSDAETAYVVFGIPHAVLVDRSGKILWRGNPADTTAGKSVEDRIQALLK
jgi:thiol-disulfide isomerase/thioredoxin